MAEAKKQKTTGTKSASKKNTESSAGKKQREKKEPAVVNKLQIEIVGLAVLALCILLMLSNFGLGGVVGGAVSSFFFGVFGISAFAFPILLFFGTVFYIVNKICFLYAILLFLIKYLLLTVNAPTNEWRIL